MEFIFHQRLEIKISLTRRGYLLGSRACVKGVSPPFYREDENGNLSHLAREVRVQGAERRKPCVLAGYQPTEASWLLLVNGGWLGEESSLEGRCIFWNRYLGIRTCVTQRRKFFPVPFFTFFGPTAKIQWQPWGHCPFSITHKG